MSFTPEQVRAAISTHCTVFFDHDLNPIKPYPGQWFCEFEIEVAEEGNEVVRDQSLVEYVAHESWMTLEGAQWVSRWHHVVQPEGSDDTRATDGDVLILQH